MEPQFVVIEKFILLPWQHDMTLLRAKTYQKAVCRFFFPENSFQNLSMCGSWGLKKCHSIFNFFLLLSATCTVFFFFLSFAVHLIGIIFVRKVLGKLLGS